jgi:WD40 repeat protein
MKLLSSESYLLLVFLLLPPVVFVIYVSDRLTDMVISADSRWLLTAAMDCTLRVWDIPAAQCLQVRASLQDFAGVCRASQDFAGLCKLLELLV